MSDETLRAVLTHPGFFRIERQHRAHYGECDESCWRFAVGASHEETGRCHWWYGTTLDEAVSAAAIALGLATPGTCPHIPGPRDPRCECPDCLGYGRHPCPSCEHQGGGDPDEWPADLRVREIPRTDSTP